MDIADLCIVSSAAADARRFESLEPTAQRRTSILEQIPHAAPGALR
jgi:hypothetical protein